MGLQSVEKFCVWWLQKAEKIEFKVNLDKWLTIIRIVKKTTWIAWNKPVKL